MARLKTKWNQKERQRSGGQVGGVVAVNIWHAVCECLVNLENENFETATQLQRLDVLAEFCAFAVHAMDRMIYRRVSDDYRAEIVHAVAMRLNELIDDNRRDGGGDSGQFIELLNRRGDEYADYRFEDEPGWTMRRRLGEHVQARMGERDNKWIADYVIDAEAPNLYGALKRVCAPLLKQASQAGGERDVASGERKSQSK